MWPVCADVIVNLSESPAARALMVKNTRVTPASAGIRVDPASQSGEIDSHA